MLLQTVLSLLSVVNKLIMTQIFGLVVQKFESVFLQDFRGALINGDFALNDGKFEQTNKFLINLFSINTNSKDKVNPDFWPFAKVLTCSKVKQKCNLIGEVVVRCMVSSIVLSCLLQRKWVSSRKRGRVTTEFLCHK